MNERLTADAVTQELAHVLSGASPLVAILAVGNNMLLLGRDSQRWLVTVEEIPTQ